MGNLYKINKTESTLKRLSFIIIILIQALSSFSEGTKQIQPASGDRGMLVLDAGWSNFAQYNCIPEERLQIRICNPNEKIYFGFRYLGSGKTVEYRIKNEAGTVVMGPANLPTTGAGYITSYSRAVAGPSTIVGAGTGYTPLTYTAPTTGDYYIEFRIISGGARIEFDYFDITVSNPAGNTAIPGRVWSKSWMLSTGDYGVPFRGKMFVYADDSIVTSLNFNGMDPYVFVLNANKTGTNNSGNPALDRMSQRGKATYPQYKVFLNNPDEACYPTGKFGNITAPTTITGCPPTNFCINVFVDRPGTAQILLELNGIPGHQNGTRDRILSAAMSPPGGCIPWDGKDGQGNLVTTGLTITTTVEFYNGLTNIPLYDVERHPNGYIVELVRPAGTISKLFWDDNLIPGGSANLNGTNSPSHTWNWNCCNNNANDYGNTNTINTWWYADSTRSVTTNVVPPAIYASADTRPTGGAGGKKDTLICGNLTTYQLAGQVLNATGGTWSTTGTGTFSSATNLTGVYNISAADRSSGSVKLILRTTGNGSCPEVRDTLTLRFQPVPTATAGAGASVCANNPTVTLSGSFANATGAVWSSAGGGTFSPSATTMNATYTPSAAEIAAGVATLTLTTTGNNKCSAAISPIPTSITITPSPTVDPGTAQTVCQNSPNITLAGSVTNATSQTWSAAGGGTFSPNNTSLNAVFTPTAAQITAGTVTLTLTATRAGCNSVSANVTMTIQPSPTANAGSNLTMCYNIPTVALSGSGTNATTFTWSGGGGVFTPNANTLNATYNPTTAERDAGSFVLTLTASRAGCAPATSNVTVTVNPAPVVDAGFDGTVCGNRPQYNLNATSSTGSGSWMGLGTFVPNANSLTATYTPDASEIASGVAAVILTSNNNLNCSPVKDTLLIFITPAPTNNAGIDQSVCSNNPSVTLAGTASNASSNVWSGGNGTFSPNTNSLNATYTPTAAEISNGSVTLTLTSNRTTCNAVTDNITINFTPAPTINAGADRNICYNNPAVTLNGAVTVATGGTWSGGAGTFSPNALTTTYTPTTAELNNGSITLTLTSTGNNNCNAVTDQVTLTVTPSPTVNAGTPQSVCANNPAVTLNGSVTVATGGTWSGGAGTFTPNANTLNATYTPTAAEIAAGSVTLTLTSTNNGNCNPVSSNVVITYTPAPTANAGTDRTICADNAVVNLNGLVTVASGGTWSGGTGTFTPNNNSLNASYAPSLAEITAGTVTLTLTTTGNTSNCNAVTDQVVINILPRPVVNAGTDQIICAAAGNIALNGTISAASGAQWTTSGSGTFSPNATTLNASYVPSAADKTAGTVTLTLTTTGVAPCVAVNDQMVITFTGVPSISAGPDQIVCTNAFPIQLNGSGSPAKWSAGSGTFSNSNILNPTYTPSAAEVTAGTVTLTITTNPSGACPTVSDQVTISLPPAPLANAGPDQTMCGNASNISLNGSVTNAVGGFWTTSGTGSFSPNNTTLNATYIPSALDKTNGSVILTLETTGNGPCGGHQDQMTVTIQPAIVVTAGPDQNVCSNTGGFTLSGASIQNASGATWTTSGSGSFSSTTAINPVYTPSAADITAGTVTLTIATTGNGVCPSLSDAVTYTIRTAPTINAGTDQTICSTTSDITLNGTVSAGYGIQWTSAGTGTFTPNTTTANATYTPSAADVAAGTVTLTIASTGNGVCAPTTDQMIVTITPKPTVNAGLDQTVCGDIAGVSLTGTTTIVSGGNWTTSGDGTFASSSSLTTNYIPGANDITNGTVTLTLTSNANGVCTPASDQMIVTITPIPTVNAGTDRSICKNNSNVNLLGTVTIAGGGIWSGGLGSFNPSNTDLSTVYSPTAAELAAGSVTLTLTTTNNGLCNPKSDQVVITFTDAPTINAGTDLTICSDSMGVQLNGTFTVASGATWTTSGTGNFFANNTIANATYVPSLSDRTSGVVTLTYTTTGNGNCNAVSDEVTITITPAPTVNAGSDQTVCANNSVINVSGSHTVASGVHWASSGTGTFADANSSNTSYTPSALDIAAGNVTVTLTTTGNGSCKAVTDQLIVTITPAPTVNAGPDQSVCANNPVATLNGNFTVASGAVWTTSGNGTFSPNNTTKNATYTPSPMDISNGSVTLTLTTQGNGLCNAVSDQVIITITPAPTVNAGTDRTICADAAGVTLNGAVTVATGGIWTSNGTGIFAPNAATLNAVYSPSAADTVAKSVRFILTSTNNGNCLAVKDTMMLTIVPKPVVNAGPDQTLCANVEFVNLSGSVKHATGGTWSTSGTGFFSPDANTLNAQYIPTGAEANGGSITLTLTSSGNGTCNAVTDQMIINLQPIPTANAGPDQTLCANNATIQLNGTVKNATGGAWSSNGDGTFANENALVTTYTPSADDLAAGSVVLTLSTTGSGVCNSNSDQLQVTFTPAPIASAGNDQTVCANNNAVTLTGVITVAGGAQWSTSGSGSFSPSINSLNATYFPSAADVTAGNVTLTLTTTSNGICNAATDQLVVTITPAPTVNPGTPQTVCANNPTVTLNGSVTVATGGVWSTASGSGTFTPNNNTLNATFTPTSSQISNGRATLTLTTTGNGNCLPVSAQVLITIQPTPTVNAGPDVSVCTGTPSIGLSGTVTNVAGATWTTSGSGTFNPNANTLNATYIPSAADNVDGNTVTLTLTTPVTGACSAVSDQMSITFQTTPVSAGPDVTVCSNALPIQLNGSGSGTWSGGLGTFSDPSSLSTTYNPAPSEIPGTVTLTLTGTAVGACIPSVDQIEITIIDGPVASAGIDQNICSNNGVVTLSGTITNAGGGVWKTEGSGTFGSTTDLATTYTASPADTVAGSIQLTLITSGNGICPADSSSLTISFTPSPKINAGNDQASCANAGAISLNGAVVIASGGVWTTSGSGTFGDENALSTTYSPSADDYTMGSVTLSLTSNAVNNCLPVTDNLVITFGAAPTADAGSDQTICADAAGVNLSGAVTIAGGGQWSTSGSGIFTPSNTALNATYVPSANDLTATTVTLTLVTLGNGNCNAESDEMDIHFTPAPTIDAGANQTVCSDITSVSINAAITVASNASWTSSGTGTFANENNTSTTYTPSAADMAAGSVILIAETTGNGTCNSYSDYLTVFFTPTPTINAGNDQSVCKDVVTVDLGATTTVATGGTWSTSGNGTFTGGANNLATTYTPSADDKTAGSVTLTVLSTGNGTCNAVTDQLIISFTEAPLVNVSQDRNICSDKDSIHVSGSFTVASGIIWSTNGTGSFLDASSPNAVYYPSALDQGSPTITLTMTTTGNGTCNPASNQILVTVSPQPVVDAGVNMSICAGQANAVLNGTVTNATGGVWTSTGTGTFNDANSVSTTYIPTPQDFLNGGILLTLTSTGNGVCAPVSDVISVNILPSPAAVVNAGLDQVLCSDVTEISLTGYISNAGGGLWSTTATGTFTPDNTTLEAKYVPTAADKTAGMVVLTLATTDNGMCSSVADDMKVTFTPAPTVTVSGPASVCGDVAGIIPVNGSFTVATGGIWTTGGTGVFAPDASGNAPTYYPSPVDKAIGKVGLTYTTTGNGTCQPVSQTLTVTITKPPVINAGADQIVCASNTSVNLNAFVSIATGGTWVTSGSGTFGNAAALSTVYNPSPADTANKVVNLLVTSTGNGTCTPVTDAVKITFSPVPITIAGADKTVCANNSSISVVGKVHNATGGIWTTNGSGNFANPTGLTTAYTPSAADITNGNVTLKLESTGNGKCSPVADQLTITLQPVPQVKAGTAMICQIEYGAPLAGDITSAVGGVWSTNGTGVFAPDNTDLNAVYYPSLADAAKGNVTLTLTSTGNGECASVSENTILSIDPMPIANAGADRYTCPGSTITLAAQPGTGLFYNWLQQGVGIIGSGSNIQVTPTGRTNYILAVTNAKGCTSTDTLTADLFVMPTLNLLPNYCLSNSLIIDGIPTPQPSVPGSYSWTLDGQFVSGNNTPIISPIDPGQYILTFEYENCIASDVTRVNPKPKLIGGFLTDCIGKATDITVKANGGGYLYNWSNGLSGTDINTINVSVTADTTYYVATVTNPVTSCINKDSVRVIGISIPNLNLTDISSCEGLSFVLNGRPSNIANLDSLYPEYVWTKDNNIFATDVDSITVNTTGLYKEVLTIGQCITADSAQVDFHVNPISNLPDYTKFCKADDNKAIIDAGSGANHTYVWTAPPGIVLDSSNTQSITVRKEGTYYVTVTNQFNCSIEDSIFVDELCGPRTDGPNAIIPGDPQNGTFRIYGAYFKNYKLMIFNRWGEVIFESTNQKEGWDGTYLGEPMPIGVYPYLVTYDSEDPSIGEHYKKEGSVMIIR